MKKQIIEAHQETYNLLADEYEARVESLRPVVKASISNFTQYLSAGARVLDVGCGAGLAIETLRSLGYDAVGIELAPRMATEAQKRNPEANIIIGDYLTEDLGEYDGILAFAFIHLFPKNLAIDVLQKMCTELKPERVMLIGTTKSETSSEGYAQKADYQTAPPRFRKQWMQAEFEQALSISRFNILSMQPHRDPDGKSWLDYIVQADNLCV